MVDRAQPAVSENGPIAKSIRSRLIGKLRSATERTIGRGKIWSWLWEREFDSLLHDKYGSDEPCPRD